MEKPELSRLRDAARASLDGGELAPVIARPMFHYTIGPGTKYV